MTEPVRLDDLISDVVARQSDGDPLRQLAAAVETSTHLGDVADHLVGHFVDEARRAGASWSEIGSHLGVTKQAAQKRFVPRESEDPDFPSGGRLSRFTGRARSVVMAARTEATERGHHEVRNEHLVLGLLSEPQGLAARAIEAVGPPADQVNDAVIAMLPARRRRKPVHIRLSRGTKKTVELGLREALRHGHNYIGTEHLLLGVLRNQDETAAALLIGLGVTYEKADAWLRREIAALQSPPAAGTTD